MEKLEKTNKRKVWSKEETRLFLSCYKARKDVFDHPRKKRHGYSKVLKDMLACGFDDKNVGPASLEGKMRTLLLTYKSAKEISRQTGKRCKAPFMAELDEIFSEKIIERNGDSIRFSETLRIPSGKTRQRANSCRLCMKNCTEYKSLFDSNGRASTVYSTTIKYFDPMHLHLTQEYPQQEIAICLLCWSRICEFDSFKYSILMAQTTMNTIKPTTLSIDDGNKLERYFGKQQGYDPLDVDVSVKNEAAVDLDEADDMDYSEDDDDRSDGDDVVEDDTSISAVDTAEQQVMKENEESGPNEDTDNEYIEECNNPPEPDGIEQRKVDEQKPLPPKFKNNIESLPSSSRNGKFVKLISKYREPDDEVDNSYARTAVDYKEYDSDCDDLPLNRKRKPQFGQLSTLPQRR